MGEKEAVHLGIRFVLGRAGSGKSRRLFEDIGAELRARPDGPPIVLLVPEQMTQAADRAFAAAFGGTVRAQSLSFRRLAFRVMQEVGGAARLHIDDIGKKMLLYKIARKRSAELRAFRRLTDGGGWIDAVHEWYDECKRYLVDASRLRELAAAETERKLSPLLRDKLHDLSLLIGDMEAELSGRYVDSEDYLALLAEHVPRSASMRDARFYVDGFHGFTPLELKALRMLCKHAAEVTVALTLDRDYAPAERPDELELFHPTATTLLAIKSMAAEDGVPVEETVVLRPGERFHPSLAAVEDAFVRRMNGGDWRAAAREAGEGVTICAASGIRAEIEAAARDIVRAVQAGEARWRDVAVFVRNWEGYGDVVSATFADFGIPFFLDQKRSVSHHPLSELLRAALDVVSSRWSYDAVFRAIKTELLFRPGTFRSETEERFAMDKLENVVLEYGIKGSRWTDDRPWRLNAAVSLEDDEPDAKAEERRRFEEERINRWRAIAAAPLSAFERRLKKAATMREQAEALYSLLEDAGAAETLLRWRDREEAEGRPERAKAHEQMWDRAIDALDQLVELVGDEPADAELFAGMIAAGLDGIRMGLVPPALDQVLVGSLDRTRTFGVKRLYLLGVNDGVIPARPKEKGVVTEAERERLLETGLALAPDIRRRLLDERFMLYASLFLASEALWISYATADPEGAATLPSEWIKIARQLSPKAAVRYEAGDAPAGDDDETALERLTVPGRAVSELLPQLRRWSRGEPVSGVWWAVYNWLCERPYWREKLAATLPALRYDNREDALSPETAVALYGETVRSSVSRLERFASCPFSHFAAYGLKLAERRLYRLEAPDIGQLYHAALSKMAKRLAELGKSWADLGEAECLALAYEAVDELAPKLMAEILFSTNRHRYVTRKLKTVVGKSAEALRGQAVRSGFRQAAAELAFGSDGDVPPIRFTLPTGAVMELSGRIDRIDRADGANGAYLRVVDYKSRQHRLSVADVYYGLSLQLLAYLDAAAEHAKRWLGADAEPAGALYFHVHRPTLTLANAIAPEQAAFETFRSFKMRGLVLDDEEAARLMDTALDKGISPIAPLEWKTDGTLSKRSAAADARRWSLLRKYVREKMAELGAGIGGGVVSASPYRRKKETPCSFCRFKPVCAFDPELEGNEYRLLPALTEEEAWERIEREGGAE